MVDDPIAIDSLAVGGEGVGRLLDGRVVFVKGALPGDVAHVEIVETKKRHARATITRILEPSSHRREPPCDAVGRDCGGCDWQHIHDGSRRDLVVELVDSVLRRQGGVVDAASSYGGSVPSWAYRTTVRLTVDSGRPAFRAHRSHDPVHVEECLIAAELLAPLIATEWPDAEDLTLRCGIGTGERLAIVGPKCSPDLALPEDVRVVGSDELRKGTRAWIHERAAGRLWRVSARTFFQSGPAAADLLVDTVADVFADDIAGAGTITDLYGGMGLFTGALAHKAPKAKWTLVESSRSALADAKVNLADVDVSMVGSRVERHRARRADMVIADPPRTGLRSAGVEVIRSMDPASLCLVSCDLGSLGRDTALLRSAGFEWAGSVVLDLFPQTSHVEVVSRFNKS